jgi:spore maturation protein CgeB
MKVLVYRWKVYHLDKIIRSLERQGCQVVTRQVGTEDYNDDADFVAVVRGHIREEAPDWVFTVNYYGTISDACEAEGKPYVAWTCDSPLIAMYHQSVYNRCNFLFIFDRVQYVYFKQLGLGHVYYLPLAAECGSDAACAASDGDEGAGTFSSEISFVGSLYARNAYDDVADRLSPYLRGYFDAAFIAQADIFGENLFDRLLTPEVLRELSGVLDFRQSERAFSDLSLVFNTTFLGFKMARHERLGCLGILGSHHQVKLYTDEEMLIPGVRNMGAVDYGTDMEKVFKGSRINLNLTLRNIRSGIPLRVWDILGCGGFCLTNFQAEFLDLFQNGRELVWFESLYDLQRKADYYLSHEDERLEVAARGLECARRLHGYDARTGKILEVIGSL